MKRELLDKEVLCIIDTRQIQKYLFHSTGDTDHYGASVIISNIINSALKYAVKNIDELYTEEKYLIDINVDAEVIPFFIDKNVQMEVITNSAGNSLILFRTGRLCQKIIRKVSRYYLDNTYCLDIAVSVVERTENFTNDLNNLFAQLDLIKADFSNAQPLGPLPIVDIEQYTGEPGYMYDKKGNSISKSRIQKRVKALSTVSIREVSELYTETGPENKQYVAVGHIDGNNMGMLIATIFKKNQISYDSGIKLRRIVDRNIATGCKKLISKSLNLLRNEYFSQGISDEEFEKYIFVVTGGDDINFACTPSLAMSFVRHLVDNIKSVCLYKDDDSEYTMSVSAGVVYMEPNIQLRTALNFAENCCSTAKKKGKKTEYLVDGLCGNWVDFEIMKYNEVQSLDVRRKSMYITSDGVNLIQRPLTMEPSLKNTNYYFPEVLKKAKIIKDMNMPDKYFNKLERSYSVGIQAYNSFISVMEQKGYDLKNKLGKPLSKDAEGKYVANWFDATELSYFM